MDIWRDCQLAGADAIAYVLPMTARYLLENAYGDYRLAVSHGIEDMARMAALSAYAGHVEPQSVTFSAWTADTAACTMVATYALLLPTGLLKAGQVPGGRPALRIQGDDSDRRTTTLLDMQLLPARARMDAGHVRNRIATSACANLGQITAVRECGASVIRAVAALAGDDWPGVADRLERGEVMARDRICE
ncbi:hypothetical protein [Bifidobacterium vespertilionis]|uniref:hypothetical protein n=1 Tax=Bifidobacterium vespertilionis TaxID=2562524 RepID=UPI001BDC3EA6|nr:hypothetical protein [Bifidobacterium vespertilionis]MBT1178612.1 hypothetical protein [Bifidobacterium vespertilionis]